MGALASALPATTAPEQSSANASASAESGSDGTHGSTAVQVYYSLAIGACIAGVVAFIVTYLCRRRQQRRRAARMGEANENTFGLYNDQDPGLGQEMQPHLRQQSRHIVLTDEQFDLLPQTTRGGAPPSGKPVPGAWPTAALPESESELEPCSICLSDIVAGETAVLLVPCNHAFHADCARRWLTRRSTLCPLCKADMCEGLGIKPPKPVATGNGAIELTDMSSGARNAPATTTITITTIPPHT
ncbi:hypothetical protein H4R21_002355 [Coemansia helicoidea]|uniref:Uncharacterized protein n=1 Tax=Coemansia helicoidea TaxID=1286919 RepID=A0ACC1L7V4_9FUNG|nr:hypothetical protein H4R21_002355 [Coemansia helicoidea]